MTRTETTRTETDSLGTIDIDADRYWGPQTERARLLFKIGVERFPPVLIRAVGLQKQASAEANAALGELPPDLAGPIAAAAAEIAAGRMDAEFPLPVWQTGSGTQTNMNANEVIANRANEILGQPRGSRSPVHPNDHVNRGQSSNDSFPTVMHVAAAEAVQHRLIPALQALHASLARRAAEWDGIVKVGRTHMMDAVPVTLGQEAAAGAGPPGGCHAPAAEPAAGWYGGRHRAEPAPGLRPGVLRADGGADWTGLHAQPEQVRGHGGA